MTDILMPKLSDSMERGTIISWFKSDGEAVRAGDELLEIETDKSTAPYEAEADGVLQVVAPVGSTVEVGAVIARLVETGVGSDSDGAATPPGELPAERVEPATVNGKPDSTGPAGEHGRQGGKATPLARRVAAAHGVALETVTGSGPLGRITRGDVMRAAGVAEPRAAGVEPWAAEVVEPVAAASTGPARRQQLSRLQQLIARRMTEAKSTIPHFQVQTEASMDAVLGLRDELKRVGREGEGVPSVNDLIVKACALALRAHPLANGSYRDDGFELHEQINIGVAVATEGALIVPTIFNADSRPLMEIASEVRRLAARVREGTIAPQELEGGTFTVSNLGMFGMTAITPVVNPPQAAILGVGAIRPTLARVDGEIVERSLMTLTLSCDHRILYGADAARFLAEIRGLLEAPLRLAL